MVRQLIFYHHPPQGSRDHRQKPKTGFGCLRTRLLGALDDWPTTWPAEPVKPSRKLCAQRNQCRIDSAHSAFARAGLAQFLAILRLVSRKFPAIPEQVSARLTRSIRHMGGDFTTGMQGIALLARRENDKGSSLFFTNKYIVLYGIDADFPICLTSASLPDRGTDPSRARSNRHQSPPENPRFSEGPIIAKRTAPHVPHPVHPCPPCRDIPIQARDRRPAGEPSSQTPPRKHMPDRDRW